MFASLAAVAAIVYPSFTSNGQVVATAFGQSRDTLEQLNLLEESNSYSDGDDYFVQQVLEVVDEDELVINIPADGSISAYMRYGINLYFKALGLDNKTEDCSAIMASLYQYSYNDRVQKAIDNTGAKYVLLLDRNGFVRAGETLWSTNGSMKESD